MLKASNNIENLICHLLYTWWHEYSSVYIKYVGVNIYISYTMVSWELFLQLYDIKYSFLKNNLHIMIKFKVIISIEQQPFDCT